MLITDPKELVKQTRLKLALSQRSFGAGLGVSGENVRQWEEGITEISEKTLNKALRKALADGAQDIVDFCLDMDALLHRNRQAARLNVLSTMNCSMAEAPHVS